MTRAPYVVCSGGGTGGHLAPGLSVVRALEQRLGALRVRFLIIGRKVERNFLDKTPYETRRVVTARAPQHRWQAPLALAAIGIGAVQCLGMYLWRRPSVVIGLGGYGSIPGVLAAWLLRIPVFQIEVNRVPGVAVRTMSGLSQTTFTAFESASKRLKGPSACYGVPLREGFAPVDSVEARERFGLERERITVAVIGGSQGARCLNRAMMAAAPRLAELGAQVLHQTGPDDAADVGRRYADAGLPSRVEPFIDDMAAAYSAADIVVARAGASTVAEIKAIGRAAVFVPFEAATAAHQLHNVDELARDGAAEVLTEAEALSERFTATLESLIADGKRRRVLAETIARHGRLDAAGRIAETIVSKMKTNLKSVDKTR